MAEKKYSWQKVADEEYEIEIKENGIAVVQVKDKKLCMTKYQDRWFAFAYKCPHASGILADGFIDATGNLVCPVHRYKFGLQNGRNTSGEGFYMKVFPVEQRTDGIFIGMEEGGLFGWF